MQNRSDHAKPDGAIARTVASTLVLRGTLTGTAEGRFG